MTLFAKKGGYKKFVDEVLNDPSRNMLGQAQREFIANSFASNKSTWNIMANQVLIGKAMTPDLTPHVTEDVIVTGEKEWPGLRDFVELSEMRLPLYTDSWGGYPAAREKLYEALIAENISDLLVLTGDAHEFWANDLRSNDGTKMGVELGTSSITSKTLKAYMGDGIDDYGLLLTRENKDVRYYNATTQGYIELNVTHKKSNAKYIAIDSVDSADYNSNIAAEFDIKPSNQSLKLANPKGLNIKQRALFHNLG